MSRVIRSRDLEEHAVGKIDLESKATGAPNPDRPRGGVLWLSSPGAGREEHVSHFERSRIEAEAGAERAQQEAYHEGFAQGESAGKKLAAQKAELVLKSLSDLLESIGAARHEAVERFETELIRLSVLIATKIVHRELETSQDVVVSIAREALGKVVKAKQAVVAVSPYDLEMLRGQVAEGGSLADWLPPSVSLEADFEIGRGGCKIMTDSGEIDATIETQIRAMKSLLWNA